MMIIPEWDGGIDISGIFVLPVKTETQEKEIPQRSATARKKQRAIQ